MEEGNNLLNKINRFLDTKNIKILTELYNKNEKPTVMTINNIEMEFIGQVKSKKVTAGALKTV